MVIVDLFVGLVVCLIIVYWGWVIYFEEKLFFGFFVIFVINVVLVNVSFGYMFLLIVDRVFFVIILFYYCVKVIIRRVFVVNCVCWIYFLVFGCVFFVWWDYFVIMGVVYNV